jgi:hypothetical protein
MKSLYVLHDRMIRLDCSCREARAACDAAERQIHETGRFAVEAPGGYVFGYMTPHGAVVGR